MTVLKGLLSKVYFAVVQEGSERLDTSVPDSIYQLITYFIFFFNCFK